MNQYTRIISKYIYLSVSKKKFDCSNHLTHGFHSSLFLYKHSRVSVSVFARKLATSNDYDRKTRPKTIFLYIRNLRKLGQQLAS